MGSLASEYAVDIESPEQAVRQALQAILMGEANPLARLITDAAGVIWVTPQIWAREDSMTPETARQIITQALADETWETPAPEDDDQAIADAQSLLKMAEDAWEQNIRGPEVEAILRIAAAGEEGEEPAAKPKPAAKAKPKPAAAKPAKPGRPKPAAKEPEPEPEPEAAAPEEPWENYDRDTVKDIVEGVEVWAESLDENGEYILNLYRYEQANKNRKNIIAACEAALPAEMLGSVEPEAAAEPEPEPVETTAEEIPAEWAEEPFEQYDSLKVADIKESLTDFFESEEYDEESKLNVLNHTYYYEQANKNRSGLIDYLDSIRAAYEEATTDGDQEGATPEAGDAEGTAAPEADEEPASRFARRKGGGETAEAAAGEGAASNGAAYTVKAVFDDATVEYELGGKHAVAGTVLDLIEAGATAITVDG